MARFSRFGATHTQVSALYPGSVTADYDAGGTAGQTVIEAVMDRVTREVAAAMSPEVYRQMTQVDAEEVVRYATASQTTATLGLTPITAGTVHLWIYPGEISPVAYSSGTSSDAYFQKPVKGWNEIASSSYSVTAATGAIVLTGSAILALGQKLYATYDVDVDSASFSMPSVADLVVLGAAAELGGRLYSESTQEWKLVQEYRSSYSSENGFLASARAGTWIPDELRKLNYYSEVERSSQEVMSVRLRRG